MQVRDAGAAVQAEVMVFDDHAGQILGHAGIGESADGERRGERQKFAETLGHDGLLVCVERIVAVPKTGVFRCSDRMFSFTYGSRALRRHGRASGARAIRWAVRRWLS